MVDTQKLGAMSQTSNNIQNVHSKPTLHTVEWPRLNATSSASHHPQQAQADTEFLDDWIRDLPQTFQDVNEGLMKDLMAVVVRYFEEIEIAAARHQGAPSVREVLELREKFRLWADGFNDPDRRLVEDPPVRRQLVSNLLALLLVLSTGIKLFLPEHQDPLYKDTYWVIEQASGNAAKDLFRSLSCSPVSIPEFLAATKVKIRDRIGNLYDLLPTLLHPVEDFDEAKPGQVEEIGPDKSRPLVPDSRIKRLRRSLRRSFRQLTPTLTPASGSSSASRVSRRPHANLSKSSTMQSPDSTESTSHPSSLFSDNGTRGNFHAPTDTITSTSPSEVNKSNSMPTTSNSTRASLSCKNCGTTVSRPADLKTHSCRFLAQPIVEGCSLSDARFSQHKPIRPYQLVEIWGPRGQKEWTTIALLDTGINENVISRSIVERCDLVTTPTPAITLKLFADKRMTASECVYPIWSRVDCSKRHQEFRFYVVPKIPGERGMVLGNIAMEEMGIQLCINDDSALIAFEDDEDLPTQEKERRQHERQTRDVVASQDKTRQALVAEYADLVQQKAAANASRKMESENSTSQKDAAGSGDV